LIAQVLVALHQTCSKLGVFGTGVYCFFLLGFKMLKGFSHMKLSGISLCKGSSFCGCPILALVRCLEM